MVSENGGTDDAPSLPTQGFLGQSPSGVAGPEALAVQVRHRPSVGVAYVAAYAILVCGVASAGLAARDLATHHLWMLPSYVGFGLGLLALLGDCAFMSKISSGRRGRGRTIAGIGGLHGFPEGALAAVGLMSQQVEHRQFPFVGTELSYLGSFWGNHLDLVEVLSLAEAGQIKHNVTKVKLEDINENLEALGHGDVVGRRVIVFDGATT